MRLFFVLIGFIFDIMVLCAAVFTVYCAVHPPFFDFSLTRIYNLFDTVPGRLQVAGAGLFFLFLVFVRFLIALRREDANFELKRDSDGSLSVSRATLESLVGRIAGQMQPPAKVEWIEIKRCGEGLKLVLKINVDFARCNVSEYSRELNSKIRQYFQESLGIKIEELDVKAALAGGGPALPVPAVNGK